MLSSKLVNASAPDWLTMLPIAHRGLHDEQSGILENSMSAFQQAIKAGLPIEFDVHLSADLKPVVFHDDTLLRMTGDDRRVCDVPAAELATLRLGCSQDPIPDLQSVLDKVAGKVPLVVELKQCPYGREVLAEKTWNILKAYQGDFSIQSFDPFTLKWFRLHAPDVIRGQLSMRRPPNRIPLHRRFLMRHMMLNSVSKPHYIGFNCNDVHWWSLRLSIKRNIKLLAWTVSNEDQLRHARRYADNVIFENLPLNLVIEDQKQLQ